MWSSRDDRSAVQAESFVVNADEVLSVNERAVASPIAAPASDSEFGLHKDDV